jgi:hypothetical protein
MIGKITGLCLILLGFWTTLFIHAFGSMISPSVSDREWWIQYFRNTSPGVPFHSGSLVRRGPVNIQKLETQDSD